VTTAQRLLKAKVCLVGEGAAGKTSLIRRFVLDQFDDAYILTLAAKVSKKVVEIPIRPEGTISIEMAVWDVMGQRRFRDLLSDLYFEGVSGILAVADITRRQTLTALYEWVDRVDAVSSQAPLVLAVNKSDLDKAAQLSEADIAPVARAFNGTYYMTSAKTGAGVEEAFQTLGLRIAERVLTAK
jgi:small GTP-binding protein